MHFAILFTINNKYYNKNKIKQISKDFEYRKFFKLGFNFEVLIRFLLIIDIESSLLHVYIASFEICHFLFNIVCICAYLRFDQCFCFLKFQDKGIVYHGESLNSLF